MYVQYCLSIMALNLLRGRRFPNTAKVESANRMMMLLPCKSKN